MSCLTKSIFIWALGQFGLPWDKRQPYEMDIRIPLMVRGPGLPHKQLDARPVLNIDFAPTLLAMAGLEAPAWMDGLPFFPFPQSYSNNGTEMNRKFLIEYHGEGGRKTVSPECPYGQDDTISVSILEFYNNNHLSTKLE
jgi:N-acetylglucosamine-6-sulfatase